MPCSMLHAQKRPLSKIDFQNGVYDIVQSKQKEKSLYHSQKSIPQN